MLVLTRKKNERIEITPATALCAPITITVVSLTGGKVRIGIEAPDDVAIIRPEAKLKVKREQLAEAAA